MNVVRVFLQKGSGGDRPQTVIGALFEVIGARTALFAEIQRGHINAADAASGQSADIECLDADGNVVLAVEVKDQPLTLRHVQDKIPGLREQNVPEALFMAFKDLGRGEGELIHDLVKKEFSSGQNIYVINEPYSFIAAGLTLIGEKGRSQFLKTVGQHLDEYKANISDRRAWADLLGQL